MLLHITWLIGLLLNVMSIWMFPLGISFLLALVFFFKFDWSQFVAFITLLARCGFSFAYYIGEGVVWPYGNIFIDGILGKYFLMEKGGC